MPIAVDAVTVAAATADAVTYANVAAANAAATYREEFPPLGTQGPLLPRTPTPLKKGKC